METCDLIRPHLQRLVADLVLGDFTAIVADGRNGQLTAEEIQRAVDEYPERLSSPPISAFDTLDMIRVITSPKPTFSIDFDMWSEGHQIDLTLSCTVVVEASGQVAIRIDNLHVL